MEEQFGVLAGVLAGTAFVVVLSMIYVLTQAIERVSNPPSKISHQDEGPIHRDRPVHGKGLRHVPCEERPFRIKKFEEKVRNNQDWETNKEDQAKLICGDIRMIAACTDGTWTGDCEGGGYFTIALIETMKNGNVSNWEMLLKGMQKVIERKAAEDDDSSDYVSMSMSRKFKLSEKMSFRNTSNRGRTRSLLIGISYASNNHRRAGTLVGCHEDVKNMKIFIEYQGYSLEKTDCKILMDDGEHGYPGRDGILKGFAWLVQGAKPGDSLFLFFTGHGTHVEDKKRHESDKPDEEDGNDEAIVPADYDGTESSLLIDDDVFTELVCKVPKGVTLTAVMDCCDSGTILDLPYTICTKDITDARADKPFVTAPSSRTGKDLASLPSRQDASGEEFARRVGAAPERLHCQFQHERHRFHVQRDPVSATATQHDSEAEFARRVSAATERLRYQLRQSQKPVQMIRGGDATEVEFSRRVRAAAGVLRSKEVWAVGPVGQFREDNFGPRLSRKGSLRQSMADNGLSAMLYAAREFSSGATSPWLRAAGGIFCTVVERGISRQAFLEEVQPSSRMCHSLFKMLELIDDLMRKIAGSNLGNLQVQLARPTIDSMYEDIHTVMEIFEDFQGMTIFMQALRAESFEQRLEKAMMAIHRAERHIDNMCTIASLRRLAG